MKGMNHVTKVKVEAQKRHIVRTAENAPAHVEISRGAMFALGAAPTLIGIWAATCFLSGLIASGGPIAMAKSWFSALTGM